MPDVREGLEELSPDSDAGFAAMIAKQAGGELSDEQRARFEESDTSVAAGLEITEESTPTRTRDELGRFTSAAESEVEDEGAAPAEASEEQDDPWAGVPDSVRERVERAEKERDEAQSLIGRQGNELGSLREQVAELRGAFEATRNQPPQPVAAPVSLDSFENLVAEKGGHQAMGKFLQGNPSPEDIYNAYEVWAEYEPGRAHAWYTDWRLLWDKSQVAPAQAAPQQQDERLELLLRERDFQAGLGRVREEAGDALWGEIKPHLLPALEDTETPLFVKRAVANGEYEGFRALAQYAERRALREATTKAAVERTTQVRESKQRAQVATGSLRPVEKRESGGDTPKTTEEITAAFHKALFATETANVADGLTFGK